LWSNSQRINQYFLAPKTDSGESWGKTPKYNVDHDVEDADVVIPPNGGYQSQKEYRKIPGSNCTKECTFGYSSIDYPSAKATVASGINNIGQIVGSYDDSNGNGHGFLYSNSAFTSLDYPGATITGAAGINNSGQIVGWYGDSKEHYHGFLYGNSVFTSLDYPGVSGTFANGINDGGQIAGGYLDSKGDAYGFLYNSNTALFTSIDCGTLPSAAHSLNGDALMVVGCGDTTSTLYDAVSDNFTDLPYYALSVNNSLELTVGLGTYSGLYEYESDSLTPIEYPGADYTGASGLNDYAQVVGSYTDNITQNAHGFIATPMQ
jgi:probable HAF family extracellular repeat protein